MSEAMLRPWVADDAPALLAAVRASEDLARQFGGVVPSTPEEALEHIATVLLFSEAHRNLAVVVDGEAVGNVAVTSIETRHRTGWCHYWLARSARGEGLAAAGLATLASWAFQRGVERLELGHRLNNPASGEVARRAGFSPEGVERGKLLYDGARYDVRTWARLLGDPEPEGQRLRMDLAEGA